MSASKETPRLERAAPWLALLGSAGMMLLLNTRQALLPGWLFMALALFFTRRQRPWVGLAGLVLTGTVAGGLSNAQVFPGPWVEAFGLAFSGALVTGLVYLADKLMVGPRGSFAGTLFLP